MGIMRVSATEFETAFTRLTDQAMTEPVAITKQGEDLLVVLSAVEYARLKRFERKAYSAAEIPEEWMAAIETAEVPPGYEHLNAELE
jgi:prevent-host-death family protein